MTGLNVNQMIWVTLQLELFISSAGRKNTNSPLMGLCFINCYAKLCWTAFAGCWGHSRLAGALEETLKWIRKCRLSDVGGYDHSVVVRTKSYENDSVTVFSLLPFKSVTFNCVYLKLKQSPGVLHIRKKLFPLSKHLQAGRIKKVFLLKGRNLEQNQTRSGPLQHSTLIIWEREKSEKRWACVKEKYSASWWSQ